MEPESELRTSIHVMGARSHEGSDALVDARSLYFAYPKGPCVVCGASLRLKRGTVSALIGANGSGKSTLVKLLCGLLRPQRGTVFFKGANLYEMDGRLRARHIAYVPQTMRAVFPFTALEVVLTGRSPYTPRFRFENERDRRLAIEALAAVEAAHLAGRRMTELSGGERQMVMLARALAQEPEFLLLDEPSSSLDLKHRAALMRQLRRLRDERGLTALVVTHDLQLLDAKFDQVCAMRCGAIVAVGAPTDVLRDHVLRDVYDDEHIRISLSGGHVLVWSED